MFGIENIIIPVKHRYYLFATGTDCKPGYYYSREEANRAMYSYCAKKHIQVECVEDDKHSKKYSNHNGVRFYINRV